MKFFVGYQLCETPHFIDEIVKRRDRIEEVYFSWGSQPSGRNAVGAQKDMLPWQAEEKQRNELRRIAESGIGLNLLLNANCYGEKSLSRRLYQETGDLVDDLRENMNLKSVTATSPVMGRFLKSNFEGLEVKASVNMEIGSVEGMEYLSDSFDGFYVKRELNRYPSRIRLLRKWCDDHEKKLYLLANSGCLNYCSARQFHDNLVAHEQGIAQMDNAFEFHGVCRTFMEKPENREWILKYSNWIRPEDIHLFEGLADGVKLATRISSRPVQTLLAYLEGEYSGNILELTEPSFEKEFMPEVLNAHRFGEDYPARRYDCSGDCVECGYCKALYHEAKETLGEMMFYENEY